MRLQYSMFHETLELALLGYYGLTLGDYLLRPTVRYAIADSLEVIVGGEIYGGPDDTLWGMVGETLSAAFFEVRASF